jgi:hypothetical protein
MEMNLVPRPALRACKSAFVVCFDATPSRRCIGHFDASPLVVGPPELSPRWHKDDYGMTAPLAVRLDARDPHRTDATSSRASARRELPPATGTPEPSPPPTTSTSETRSRRPAPMDALTVLTRLSGNFPRVRRHQEGSGISCPNRQSVKPLREQGRCPPSLAFRRRLSRSHILWLRASDRVAAS